MGRAVRHAAALHHLGNHSAAATLQCGNVCMPRITVPCSQVLQPLRPTPFPPFIQPLNPSLLPPGAAGLRGR